MRVTWVVNTPIQQLPSGHLSADLASARYRALIPIGMLNRMGYQNQILTVLSEQVIEKAFDAMQADVVIFSKNFFQVNQRLAQKAKQYGARVILDMCDNMFVHPKTKDYYESFVKEVDCVTCSTPALAEIVRRHTTRPVELVDDPYEAPAALPSFNPGETLRLLWFGHPSNLVAIPPVLPALFDAASRKPIELSIMTSLTPETLDYATHFPSDPKVKTRMLPWSLNAQWKAISDCDAVIIPTLTDEHKQVKSHNRVVETLRLGKPVITHPLPAYEPFRPWIWTGQDMREGVKWLYDSQAKIPFLIQLAQEYIEKNLSPQIISMQWERAIRGGMH